MEWSWRVARQLPPLGWVCALAWGVSTAVGVGLSVGAAVGMLAGMEAAVEAGVWLGVALGIICVVAGAAPSLHANRKTACRQSTPTQPNLCIAGTYSVTSAAKRCGPYCNYSDAPSAFLS